MKNEYSQKEIDLFKYFGYDYFVSDGHISAPVIYRMMVEKAFLEDMKGKPVESLRRCQKALNSCSVYRLTPEWDAMIEMS
jgi:hypothetical protein